MRRALTLGLLASSIAYDDAWITFRYAYNVLHGNGLVYNAGERFLGTTAPGYALLLALLAIPAPESIPFVSAIVCTVSLTAVGLGLFAFGRLHGHWLGGFLAAMFFVASPVSTEAFGGEMVPQVALIVWAIVAQASGRSIAAVVLASAATIVRPDGLVGLMAVGAHQLWTRRRLPWREMAIAGTILAIWFGALWLYYGWPLPQTLAAKNAQRLSGLWRELGTDLFLWFKALTVHGTVYFNYRPSIGFTLFVYSAGAGAAALLWLRFWWFLLAWPVLYLLAYRQLHLPFYHWYAIPPLVAVAVAAAAGAEGLAALVGRLDRTTRPMAADAAAIRWNEALVGIVAMVAIVVPMARFSAANAAQYPSPPERAYTGLGRWIDANAPPRASVGYVEIGILGYYARRPIVDPLGLVNRDAAPHVARRDLLWAYQHYRPDYIIHNPAFFPEYLGVVLNQPWFQQEYRAIATMDSGRREPVVIYQRVKR